MSLLPQLRAIQQAELNLPEENVKPLLDQRLWRHSTPEKSTDCKPQATPRYPGITADHITPKHPDFIEKLDTVMTLRYHEVSPSTFLKELLTVPGGKNLNAKQVRKLDMFRELNVEKEHDMYPSLVSDLLLVSCLDAVMMLIRYLPVCFSVFRRSVAHSTLSSSQPRPLTHSRTFRTG